MRLSLKREVRFSVFQPALYEFLGLPNPQKNDVKFKCLEGMFRELSMILFAPVLLLLLLSLTFKPDQMNKRTT